MQAWLLQPLPFAVAQALAAAGHKGTRTTN
jgi:hypothetical protein